MPARGRHRRYKPGPVSRASLTVTAGGAGLALPLVSAGTGHAATDDAEQAVRAEHAQRATQPLAAQARAETRAAAAARAARGAERGSERGAERASYEVAGGDTLSSIAREHDVDDGWQGLYERNRRVVGDDPDLIFPGQRLSLRERRQHDPAPAKKQETEKREKPEAQQERKDGAEQREPAKPVPASPDASAPVAGAQTGTPYRTAGSGWSSGYHTGVDFPVPTGTAVRAVSGGEVVSAGWAGAYGYQVVLRHDDGRYSQYAHLSAIAVSDGRRVAAGQRVGRSGSTGNSTGPHLHFEVRTGPGYGSDIDPLAYLRGLGVTV